MVIKILIIDDVKEGRNLLHLFLKDRPEIEIVGLASNVDEAIEISIDKRPDLVLLDIMMPGKDGFDYISEIKDHQLSPAIIFISASENYAIRAIKHAAFDYILKPVREEELLSAVNRFSNFRNRENEPNYLELLNLLKKQKPERIRLNTRSGFFFVDPADIIHIEADGNYSHIKLVSGKSETTTMNLGSLEKIVKNETFIRISRSSIININFISRVDKKENICELEYNGISHKIKIPAHKTRLLEDYF
ncbi:MAG: LytTR family DNA-binding domain-containing protein [Bacteroidales bacterium]|nr:LytTR family DNA-binding domain-containing protein [Bacteroidales bacterium]